MKIETIKKRIDQLEELADEIEEHGIEIIENIPLIYSPSSLGFGDYHWGMPSEELKKVQRAAVRLYQRWYSASYVLIDEYLDETRREEFKELYQKIMGDFQPKGPRYSSEKSEIIDEFINRYDIQRGILSGIPEVVEIKEMNLRKLISADFVETELDEAEILFNHKFIRGAGALAGVALEKHLETMCQLNNVQYNAKDTIDPLATALYTNKILDITELKKAQHLASIRNKCDHPNRITENEVGELIYGVKKFVNTH